MVTKINSELVPLTRELAQRFAQMKPLPGERTIKASRLRFFQAHIDQQTFNSPTWSSATVAGSEDEYRADGQHTSSALASCAEDRFPQGLKVTLNTYRMDSIEDAPDLFDLFDNPMSARTNTDKIGVYVAEYPELENMNHAFLTKITRGIDYFYRDLSQERSEQLDIRLYVAREHGLYFKEEQHRSFAVWLDALSREQKRGGHVAAAREAWMINKAGLVAEMFADRRADPEVAGRFWSEVMTGSNPDKDDETRELPNVLKEWLKKSTVKQGRLRARAKKAFERYRRMFAAGEHQGSAAPDPEPEEHTGEFAGGMPYQPPAPPEARV